MEASLLKKVRDSLHGTKTNEDGSISLRPLVIRFNNQEQANEATDKVVWDDENDLLFVWRYNTNARQAVYAPVVLMVEEYGLVEALYAPMKAEREEVEKSIEDVASLVTLSDDQKKNLLNSDLVNQNNYMASVRQYNYLK